MTATTKSLRAQWLRPMLLQARMQPRHNSSRAHLQRALPQRAIQPTFEDLSPQSSYRLDMTLADFLPQTTPPLVLPPTKPAKELPIPHHLLYFEPSKRQSEMLPDGTNPDQSPGPPFERRMWAGGRVLYNHDNPLHLDGSRGVCQEFVRRVDIKGKPGEEKVFVAIERRLAKASADECARLARVAAAAAAAAAAGGVDKDLGQEKEKADLYHRVRQRLWRDSEEDFGEASILETRNIVFLRGRSSSPPTAQAKSDASASASAAVKNPPPAGGKMLKPELTPDYEHTIIPDPKLLFRFSALTFNAHAIHLDPQYSREIEGHRNLLFHGPLSFMFMMTLLQQKLAAAQQGEVIKSVEYRNMAPLYCGEKVKFAGTKTGERKWEVWAETPEGGLAVRGKVVTEAR